MFNHKSIALLIVLAMNNLAHADLSTGLVAHYPFNGNANDESGNGNNGTVYGATLTADRFGNVNSAYNFDGISNYISVSSSASLNPDNQWSMAFWINVQGFTNTFSPLLHKGGLNNDVAFREYSVWLKNDMTIHTSSITNGIDLFVVSPSISNLTWVHYVGVIDRVNHLVQIYLNGQKIKEVADQNSIFSNNQNDLRISWTEELRSYHSPFKGMIDDIRLYNRALSESEIQQLYSEGTTQQLTITKQGTGSGTVTSNPAGIDCAGGADQVCITVYPPPAGCQCSAAFPTGTAVTLTATPDTIYCVTTPCPVNTWVGWGGDCAGTANTCTVNMTADKTATATFNLGKPDFTIPVMTISPATPVTNGTFTATVTVKNQGTVAANGGQLRLWTNQPTVPVCAATGGNKNVAVGTLAAGASKTFTITGVSAGLPGIKTLRAFVDATCVSTESNETNNQRTLGYRVAGRLPDLTVTNIAITPAIPAKNTVFNATITIKNQGLSHTTMGYLDVWANQATTQTCGAIGNAWAEVGALAAGASKVITLPVASGVAGSKTLRAFVDSWCENLESNETNNQMIKTYSVQ